MCARILLCGNFTIIADTALDLDENSWDRQPTNVQKFILHSDLWAPQESAQEDDQNLV